MQVRKTRKHRYAAPVGGVFVLLAVIGVVTVILSSLNLTSKVLDNSTEKERFEEIILPVMMFDPVPFEKPSDIEMTNLLQYSMWATLTSERARNYTYSDTQELMVPASDLDVAAATLFGSDIKLEHQRFGDYDSSYAYDSEKKMYYVRIAVSFYTFMPEVREITKEGDLYCLDVYYIPPNNALNLTKLSEKLSPFSEKHMHYYMQKTKDTYQLVKVQDPPSATAASTA
ncbi:hypothetical protein LJC63_07135 [Ruminococcaceae bacterium OttesenSCG-928-L11]|nr:hypothetical protein [Ruminococcaceae bacterium OttesenSCG-928-L11]